MGFRDQFISSSSNGMTMLRRYKIVHRWVHTFHGRTCLKSDQFLPFPCFADRDKYVQLLLKLCQPSERNIHAHVRHDHQLCMGTGNKVAWLWTTLSDRQARSYVQARGGSCLLDPRRLNLFWDTNKCNEKLCKKRKKYGRKSRYALHWRWKSHFCALILSLHLSVPSKDGRS